MHDFLRTHTTVVFDRPNRGLVSLGAAARRRLDREAWLRRRQAEVERWRARHDHPDNPSRPKSRADRPDPTGGSGTAGPS